VALVARGMALDAFQEWGAFIAAAEAAGFDIEHQRALDRQVLPSLARLERLTGAIIAWPWLGRRALRKRPPARSGNVLAGYLMRSCIERGVLVYQHLVLRKRALS
jgi:hypothetical protein